MTTIAALIGRVAAAHSGRVGDRGKRITIQVGSSPWTGIEDSPEALARSAGVTTDVYSLARLSASENSSDGPAYRLAVIECAVNELQRRRRVGAPASTLSHTGNLINRTASWASQTKGLYGMQRGRWAATLQDPSASDLLAAQIVVAEGVRLVGGGNRFFSPKAQNGGIQGGRALRRGAAEVITEWTSGGSRYVGPIPGIDPYILMVFEDGSRANAGNVAEALAINDRGLKGDHGPEPLSSTRIARGTSPSIGGDELSDEDQLFLGITGFEVIT